MSLTFAIVLAILLCYPLVFLPWAMGALVFVCIVTGIEPSDITDACLYSVAAVAEIVVASALMYAL